jgi:ureidoacrylate peracid hydrolase
MFANAHSITQFIVLFCACQLPVQPEGIMLSRPTCAAVLLALALVIDRSAAFTSSSPPTNSRTSPRYSSSSSTTSLNMAIDKKLDPSETALVLIEYQNEFTTEGGALYEAVKPCLDKYGTIANSRRVMDSARAAGCTIIHVPIAFEDGHKEISGDFGILQAIKEGKTFKANEWGSAICEAMKPAPSDLICKGKSGLCGFHSTNLDFLLRQNGVKNVVLGGFLTNCCVESTMRTAYEHGYKVYTLKDCCAATSVEGQEAAFEHTFGMFSIPTTSDEIIGAVQGAPVSA